MVIHNLTTVNGGEIIQFKKKDMFNQNWNKTNKSDWHVTLEILRPENHNPHAEIVNYYYWDKQLGAKIEISLYRYKESGKMGADVYYFKKADSPQHYTSRHYEGFANMPEKYYEIIKWIYPCFIEVFGKQEK